MNVFRPRSEFELYADQFRVLYYANHALGYDETDYVSYADEIDWHSSLYNTHQPYDGYDVPNLLRLVREGYIHFRRLAAAEELWEFIDYDDNLDEPSDEWYDEMRALGASLTGKDLERLRTELRDRINTLIVYSLRQDDSYEAKEVDEFALVFEITPTAIEIAEMVPIGIDGREVFV